MMKIRVGDKGKHVEIPDGWTVINRGVVLKYDKFLYVGDYPAKLHFLSVEEDDIGQNINDYELIIREN